jgi:hypothetical protein
MPTTIRFFVEKLGGTDANTYLGKFGELFYDPESESGLRMAIGFPGYEGGIPLRPAAGSNLLSTLDFGDPGGLAPLAPIYNGKIIVNNNAWNFA